MYILEFRKNERGKTKKDNFKSFENFEYLLREKNKLEVMGNKCFVYKLNSNGKIVKRLADKKDYVEVKDLRKEEINNYKQYIVLCKELCKCKDVEFYIDNGILYYMYGNDLFEVEMVRKTPRYVVRKNGVVHYDKLNGQVDMIDLIFCKEDRKGNRKVRVRLGKELYYC